MKPILGGLGKKVLLLLAVVLVPMAAFAAQMTPFQVGVLYWSSSIPGQVAMRKGLENEAQIINDELAASGARTLRLVSQVAGDGVDGIERQIEQMRGLIRRKVDLIIVQPTDNAALSVPLQEANTAGIPVVAYDQYIDGGTITAYLTTDNYQAGYLDGEYTAQAFPDDRKLRIILVEYPHVSSTVERVNGFLDALQAAKQPYEILKTYNAVEPVSGAAAGKKILQDFPGSGSVDVVFTVNDGGGLSVVNELASAGRFELFVATIDGDPEAVKYIMDARLIHIDSAQFCGALGAHTVRMASLVLSGKKVPGHILLPAFPITQETQARFKGWLGTIPERFLKHWKSPNPWWENHLLKVNHDTGEREPYFQSGCGESRNTPDGRGALR